MRAKTVSLVLALALTLAWAAPAPPAAAETAWSVQLLACWNDPGLEEDDGFRRVEADSAFGWGAGLEARFNRRLGVELGVQAASDRIDVHVREEETFSGHADLDFVPVTLALDVHLTPERRSDLFLGPVVSYVHYRDLTLETPFGTTEIETDDDLGVGVRLGFAAPLGAERWALTGRAQFLDADVGTTGPEGDGESFEFDPLLLALGLSYRF
jgi:outer membrane protein W